SQAFHRLGILSTAAIEENADLRALFMRIPHALDQLQMRDGGAISAFLTGFTQVHVRENKEAKSPMSSQIYKSMYLGFCRDVSMAIRISPTNSIRAILAYWLKCTCSCQSRVSPATVCLWFHRLSTSLKMDGCSSHSGRRTFITRAARRVSQVGGSLRDVQELAGHTSLAMTQRYIEGDTEAKRKLVALL